MLDHLPIATLPDEALFAIENVTDFTALVPKGAPATLRLAIAAPEAMRSPALLDAIHAGLAAAPAMGEALLSGALRAETALTDAVIFWHGAKRRLHIEENGPCALYC
jgi:hypothetical protein